MKYFTNIESLQELRKQYRNLLKRFHPDNESSSEHLISFDYAYKLEAVRDWLVAQSK